MEQILPKSKKYYVVFDILRTEMEGYDKLLGVLPTFSDEEQAKKYREKFCPFAQILIFEETAADDKE